MTEINPAGWLQNAGSTHSAAQLRTYTGALLTGTFSTGTITRTLGGVHPVLGGQLAVTQNGTPNMSVNVASGVVFIPGTESTAQGVYFCENDATVNLSITTAPGSGLNRIDLIVAKVEDSFYSGATNAWSLAVVTGTAASSPTAPTPPNNSITLAQIFVGSLVTSIVTGNITDKRFHAAGLGGVIVCTSGTRPSAGVLQDGQLIYESDTNLLKVLNTANVFVKVLDDTGYQTITLGSATPSITFSGIPTTVKRVTIYWTARSDAAIINTQLSVRINGDSSTAYSGVRLQGASGSTSGSAYTSQSTADVGSILGASSTSGRYASGNITIPGWDSPHSLLNGNSIYGGFDVAASNAFTGNTVFFYNVAGPYTSISVFPNSGNLVAGSEFSLELK